MGQELDFMVVVSTAKNKGNDHITTYFYSILVSAIRNCMLETELIKCIQAQLCLGSGTKDSIRLEKLRGKVQVTLLDT